MGMTPRTVSPSLYGADYGAESPTAELEDGYFASAAPSVNASASASASALALALDAGSPRERAVKFNPP